MYNMLDGHTVVKAVNADMWVVVPIEQQQQSINVKVVPAYKSVDGILTNSTVNTLCVNSYLGDNVPIQYLLGYGQTEEDAINNFRSKVINKAN